MVPYPARSTLSTFANQAAKEGTRQVLLSRIPQRFHPRALRLRNLSSVPVCACLLLPALPRRSSFRQGHAFQTGLLRFRVLVWICQPGLFTRLSPAPTSAYKISVLPELVKFVSDLTIEDRNYQSKAKEELRWMGVIPGSLLSQEERACGKEK